MKYLPSVNQVWAMTSGGHYDRFSLPQQSACQQLGKLALVAVAKTRHASQKRCYRIADFGCATGSNSLLALAPAINQLSSDSRVDSVEISRCDLPSNDFNRLVDNVRALGENKRPPGMFESMVAGSFNDRLFPDQSVDLGICSMALHWIEDLGASTGQRQDIPTCQNRLVSIHPEFSEDESRFERAWRKQFIRFLGHRSHELSDGGTFIIAQLGKHQGETMKHGPFRLIEDAWKAIDGPDGAVGVLPVFRVRHHEAVDLVEDYFRDEFEVIFHEEDQSPNPYFASYRHHRDPVELATGYVQFIRAFSQRTLDSQLGNGGRALKFLDRLYSKMVEMVIQSPLAYEPQSSRSFLQIRRRARSGEQSHPERNAFGCHKNASAAMGN